MKLFRRGILAGYLALAAPAVIHGNNHNGSEPIEMQHAAMASVQNGMLEYSRNCGWIDWGHAIPDGPRKLLDMLLSESGEPSSDGTHYDIDYSQTMKKVVLEIEATAGVSGKYRIRRGLSKHEKIRVAYAILEDISYRFEEFQGQGIYRFVTGHSSFAEEDLPSNLMAFNRARYSLSRNEMRHICDAVGKEKSEKILENGEYGRTNTKLKPVIRNRGGRIPYEMLPPKKPQKDSYQPVGYTHIHSIK